MKKKTKGIIAGIVVLGIIGSFMSNGEEVVSEEPKQEVVQEETKEETKPTTSEIEVEETSSEDSKDAEYSEEETKEKVKQIVIDTFVETAQKLAEENFDHAVVEYDKETNIVNMNVATNGLASDVTMVKLGLADSSDWGICKDSTDLTSKTMKEELEALGVTDVSISVNVLNDTNLDNVLYISLNGFGIYDASLE